jgi:hypothetical protein
MGVTTNVATNQTKINAGGSGTYVIDQGEYAGTVKAMIDYYTLDEVEATSTIAVATPPAGSKVIGASITHDALGTAATLSLGDSDSAVRYLAVTSAAALGSIDTLAKAGANYEIGTNDGDTDALVTVGTANADGAITVIFLYV